MYVQADAEEFPRLRAFAKQKVALNRVKQWLLATVKTEVIQIPSPQIPLVFKSLM
jgi:hypothetical protein